MSKINLNLENYPELEELYQRDQVKFARVLKQAMSQLDKAVPRFRYAREVYKMDYLDMTEQVMNAFYKPENIAKQHHTTGEQAALAALHEDLHPLAIFTNGAVAYNAQGQVVTPSEWIQQENFNLEEWLYGLFYGARFVSWKELANYLSLGKYDFIDLLKAQNFEQLAKIQPALDYQEKHGIPKGTLIPGTGYFDGGDETTKLLDACPACHSTEWNTAQRDDLAFCESCRLGGRK